MYPTNVTQLAALLAALLPFTLGTISALISARTRASESRRADWKRINELTAMLYNKDHEYGRWNQVMAALELGDFRRHRGEIGSLIEAVRIFYDGRRVDEESDLVIALQRADRRLRRRWYRPNR